MKALRRCPRGFLGMLVLVVCLEGQVVDRGMRIATALSSDWSRTARSANQAAADHHDILAFGDSLVMCGFVPSVVEEVSGLSAYNLALGAGPPAANYHVFKRALDAGARPRVIVLDAFPHFLRENDVWPQRRLWAEILDVRDLARLSWEVRDSAFFASTLAAWTIPSYLGRLELRESISAALRGESVTTQFAIPINARNRRVNRGALVFPTNVSPDALAEIIPGLLLEGWQPRPLHTTYLRRLLDLAAAHGITVCWLIPPIRPDVEAGFESLGIADGYTQFVRELVAGRSNVLVLDARGSGYGSDLFADPIHLNVRGATALSVELARRLELRETVEEVRWLPLPPALAKVDDYAIEDLDQTIAVGRSTVRR